MTLRTQHKCQPNAGKTLSEKPIAWKNKELFQEDDLLSIIIYELAPSYFNVDGLNLSIRAILESEKKKIQLPEHECPCLRSSK